MNTTFNSFQNMDEVVFYLCNPNRDEIGVINAQNRTTNLRFNDLSELSLEILDDCEYYDLIEAKRLIKIEDIGWFQITKVVESDDGISKRKNISAESHQTTLKNFGFFTEERVYCFYNEDDPTDSNYDANDVNAIPSVVGQLYQQTGIRVGMSMSGTEFDPTDDYDEWTIIYIAPSLCGSANRREGTFRSFDEGSKYAYDFMCNDAAEAFQVIFDFDILHHAIKIKTVDEIVEKTNIYLSFDNLVNNIEVTENSDDVVTVLNCSGGDLDITMVNPMGTNYIVDFSYYMDKVDYRWMSRDLIEVLEVWKSLYDEKQEEYIELVQSYRNTYGEILPYEEELQYNNLKITDIKAVQEEYTRWYSKTNGGASASGDTPYNEMPFTISVFDIEGGFDIYSGATFNYKKSFNPTTQTFTFYQEAPSPTSIDGGVKTKYQFSGAGSTMTLEQAFATVNIVTADKDGVITEGSGYLYFSDDATGKTYCQLKAKAEVNPDTKVTTYSCAGYQRFCLSVYSGEALDDYTRRNAYIMAIIGEEDSQSSTTLYGELNRLEGAMNAITNEVAIANYFSNASNFPKGNNVELYRELKCYWIEGEYEDEHLSATDETTIPERISLARELMANGQKELEKVCQPRFSFTVNSVNFITMIEFVKFANELALGKIITIEKAEGLHYYPALTEMSINWDNLSDFTLTFSNAYKMNDWGFTFSDLLADASEISRKVTSNWNELTTYMKERDELRSLVDDALDLTLRAGNNNLFNQEFIIDHMGILGRQFADDSHSSFADEQVRIINNLIMFTDDKWQTIKTALGKVYFEDGSSAYGLAADTIIGKLLLGSTLKILNSDGCVTIDGDGIVIKTSAKGNVFSADKYGNLTLTGKIYSSGGRIGGWTISSNELYSGSSGIYCGGDAMNSLAGEGTSKIKFYAGDGSRDNPTFAVLDDGSLYAKNAKIEGDIKANSGTIGGCSIVDGKLIIDNANINSLSVSKLTGGTKGNFTLDANGNMTATNATISGAITATSLTITSGATISGLTADNAKELAATYYVSNGTKTNYFNGSGISLRYKTSSYTYEVLHDSIQTIMRYIWSGGTDEVIISAGGVQFGSKYKTWTQILG